MRRTRIAIRVVVRTKKALIVDMARARIGMKKTDPDKVNHRMRTKITNHRNHVVTVSSAMRIMNLLVAVGTMNRVRHRMNPKNAGVIRATAAPTRATIAIGTGKMIIVPPANKAMIRIAANHLIEAIEGMITTNPPAATSGRAVALLPGKKTNAVTCRPAPAAPVKTAKMAVGTGKIIIIINHRTVFPPAMNAVIMNRRIVAASTDREAAEFRVKLTNRHPGLLHANHQGLIRGVLLMGTSGVPGIRAAHKMRKARAAVPPIAAVARAIA